jgi:hypothetical protein
LGTTHTPSKSPKRMSPGSIGAPSAGRYVGTGRSECQGMLRPIPLVPPGTRGVLPLSRNVPAMPGEEACDCIPGECITRRRLASSDLPNVRGPLWKAISCYRSTESRVPRNLRAAWSGDATLTRDIKASQVCRKW